MIRLFNPFGAHETLKAQGKPIRAALGLGLGLLLGARPRAQAQEPIKDNSFFLEEAYNQDRGVVQHINAFSRASGGGGWIYIFTQEWPVPGQRHQASFTLPVQRIEASPQSRTGVGDLALNYRYQAVGMTGGPVAVSPRLTLLAPTGKYERSLGAGGLGLQASLPVSWELNSRVVTHWNVGLTHTFSARNEDGDKADTNSYALGQSVVWLAVPRVNFMLETVWSRSQSVAGRGAVEAGDSLYISPGIRWSYDFKSGLQIVPGLAFPIGVGPSRGEHSVFLYLSFEHPFRHNR
ncbi:MAG: transporter [Vicinamibacteria bacterium]|nr:transporter [Vicinamibacteria bacterium]